MNKSGLGTRLAVVGVCLAGLIYVVNFVIEWKPVEQPVRRPDGPLKGSSKKWLGIRAGRGVVDNLTGELRGVRVLAVSDGTPAARAGLQPGDLIVAFDSTTLKSPRHLSKLMDETPVGREVALRVRRETRFETLMLKLESGATEAMLGTMVGGALDTLVAAQAEDGSFPHFQLEDRPSPAMTALAARALAEWVPAEDEDSERRVALIAAIARLKQWIEDDGGISAAGLSIGHRSYATAAAICAMQRDNPEEHKDAVARMRDWLLARQVDEDHGYSPLDWRYGGFPYYESLDSDRLRTDLSINSWVIEGLQAAGVPSSDPCWRKMGLFLDLTQNYAVVSEDPDDAAAEADWRDGGFAFSPRNSKVRQGVPISSSLLIYPSYGSATADGLRTLIAVDGHASSPRATAALQWLARNYDIEGNPGFSRETAPWDKGIRFYYLHSLARALLLARVTKLEVVESDGDASGPAVLHSWPDELVRELARRQSRKGGYWKNTSALMNENNPLLATCLALLALDAARDALALPEGLTIRAVKPPKPPRESELEPAESYADPEHRGLIAFRRKGCTGCHIDGVVGTGPSLTGLADKYKAKFGELDKARSFLRKHIRDPDANPGIGVAPKKEGERMPRYGEDRLPTPQLEDLVTFLMSRTGGRPVSSARLPNEGRRRDPDRGARLYQRLNCVDCHGEKGHGPKLSGLFARTARAVGAEAARDHVASYLRDPKSRPSLAKPRGKGDPMPSYPPAALSDDDMQAIIDYLFLLK